MTDDSQTIKLRAICSQFFYNVLFKCTKSIAVLNKRAVMEELKLLIDEGERDVDKLTFDESLRIVAEGKSSDIYMLKTFINNLRVVSSMIAINCPH